MKELIMGNKSLENFIIERLSIENLQIEQMISDGHNFVVPICKKDKTYRFKMFKNKTISLSFLLAAWYAQERKVTPEVFANWAPKFFENPSEKYKSSLGTNSTKVGDLPNVRIRLSALQEEMDKLKNKSSK